MNKKTKILLINTIYDFYHGKISKKEINSGSIEKLKNICLEVFKK